MGDREQRDRWWQNERLRTRSSGKSRVFAQRRPARRRRIGQSAGCETLSVGKKSRGDTATASKLAEELPLSLHPNYQFGHRKYVLKDAPRSKIGLARELLATLLVMGVIGVCMLLLTYI